MRKQFVQTVEGLLPEDKRLVLFLGDIGVFGFRKSLKELPERVYNIGILEQSTVSLAAGLSMTGLIPIVHTIAPFIVERCVEQLKDDFCYQKLGGNFVSVGASYDYAALGCTHHCPGDIGILKMLPGMEIIVPGSASEFDQLFRQLYDNGNPTYFRLSEHENSHAYDVSYGEAIVIQKGNSATVLAVGPALAPVLDAVKDLDVTVLYFTTVMPFDSAALRHHCTSDKILLCEPYYHGVLASDIASSMWPDKILIDSVGVPYEFLRNYGKKEEHDNAIEFTSSNIRKRIKNLIRA
jgi:transketolase